MEKASLMSFLEADGKSAFSIKSVIEFFGGLHVKTKESSRPVMEVDGCKTRFWYRDSIPSAVSPSTQPASCLGFLTANGWTGIAYMRLD